MPQESIDTDPIDFKNYGAVDEYKDRSSLQIIITWKVLSEHIHFKNERLLYTESGRSDGNILGETPLSPQVNTDNYSLLTLNS